MKKKIISVFLCIVLVLTAFAGTPQRVMADPSGAQTVFDGTAKTITVTNLTIPAFTAGEALPSIPDFESPTGGTITGFSIYYMVADPDGTIECGGEKWKYASGTIDASSQYALWISFRGNKATSYDGTGFTITVNAQSSPTYVGLEGGMYASTMVMITVVGGGAHAHNGVAFEAVEYFPETAGDYSIFLEKDIILTGTWTVPAGTTDLCLNGHSIKMDENCLGGSVIFVPRDATLNLYDCSSGKTGKITGGTGGDWYNYGGGIYIKGTVNMYGGNITENTSEYGGGGVYVEGGSFTMNGGSNTQNTSHYCGAGVYVNYDESDSYRPSSFVLNDGTISYNVLEDIQYSGGGGGIAIWPYCTFEMNGGEISHNKAPVGGGISAMVTNNGLVKINGGTISYNESREQGGAIYVNCYLTEDKAGSFIMTGGTIENNISNDVDVMKSAVFLTSSGFMSVTMTGGSIVNNNGYGLYEASCNPVKVGKSITISENKSDGVNTNAFVDYSLLTIMDGEDAPTTMQIGIGLYAGAGRLTENGVSTDTQYFTSDNVLYDVMYDASGYLKLAETTNPVCTVTFNMNGHGTRISPRSVLTGGKVVAPANPTATGWTFGGWYDSTLTNLFDFDAPLSTDVEVYAKWTEDNPEPSPTPGTPVVHVIIPPEFLNDPNPHIITGSVDEPTPEAEKYTVPIEADKDSVQVSAKIDDGIAVVDEITENVLDDIIEENKSESDAGSESVIIDLSKAKQDVNGAELTKKSIENLADAVNNENNNVGSVVIKMKNVSVELDAKTLMTLRDSMTGSTIKLVVENTDNSSLNDKQKNALEKLEVNRTFEAYFESNGERIHDFKGGMAKILLDFKPTGGKKTENYKVNYIDEDGILSGHTTKYENGRLIFVTGHFSDFAIIYDSSREIILAEAEMTEKGNIKLSWNEMPGAVKYVVYVAHCSESYSELTETDTNSVTVKEIDGTKLELGKTYKFYVVAYDELGNKVRSRSIHFIAGNESKKYANINAIEVSEKTLELEVGEKSEVDVTYTLPLGKTHIPNDHGAAIRFTSSNPEVAKANKNGVITAKKEGAATIYVQDIGGKWCKIEVIVR